MDFQRRDPTFGSIYPLPDVFPAVVELHCRSAVRSPSRKCPVSWTTSNTFDVVAHHYRYGNSDPGLPLSTINISWVMWHEVTRRSNTRNSIQILSLLDRRATYHDNQNFVYFLL